jgi:putative addiction module component (TIGR02574 family)
VSVRLDELKREMATLTEAERAELALALIESLESWPDQTDVEEAWRREIERRSDEVDRGEAQLVPGDEVFARVRQQLL